MTDITKNIFILTSLLLFSCGTKPTDSASSDQKTDSLTISKTTDGENFNEFFERFTTDSVFQMERTIFPFRVIWMTEDGETTHKTEKENWIHSTFYYEDSYASRQVDAYTQEIRQYSDSVILEQRGVDNGIYVDYKFIKNNGKWILFTGKDYSN
jgi:hypothetical protein